MGNNNSTTLGKVEGLDDVNKEIESIISSNNVEDSQRKIKDLLERWRFIPLNICILGERGVGKSSFINNISGEKDLAEVNVKECTSTATSYPHPGNENLVFWDLPGFGARFYPTIDGYLKAMDISRFEVILYLYKDGFKQTDLELCKRIRKIDKPFFLVRSKFDNDVQGGADVEEVKEVIQSELREYGKLGKLSEQEVVHIERLATECYFIANRTHYKDFCHDYDYNKLMKDITQQLGDEKREALVFTLRTPNKTILDLKRKQLKRRIWFVATLAGGIGAIPVPGVDLALNTALILEEITFMANALGIFKDMNDKGSKMSNLECVRKCSVYLSSQGLTTYIKYFASMGLILADDVFKLIPGIGLIISSGISFVVTKRLLTQILNDYMATAITIMEAKEENEVRQGQTDF